MAVEAIRQEVDGKVDGQVKQNWRRRDRVKVAVVKSLVGLIALGRADISQKGIIRERRRTGRVLPLSGPLWENTPPFYYSQWLSAEKKKTTKVHPDSEVTETTRTYTLTLFPSTRFERAFSVTDNRIKDRELPVGKRTTFRRTTYRRAS